MQREENDADPLDGPAVIALAFDWAEARSGRYPVERVVLIPIMAGLIALGTATGTDVDERAEMLSRLQELVDQEEREIEMLRLL